MGRGADQLLYGDGIPPRPHEETLSEYTFFDLADWNLGDAGADKHAALGIWASELDALVENRGGCQVSRDVRGWLTGIRSQLSTGGERKERERIFIDPEHTTEVAYALQGLLTEEGPLRDDPDPLEQMVDSVLEIERITQKRIVRWGTKTKSKSKQR